MADEKQSDKSRLLAKLIRSMVASEHFDDLADLNDALKWRCARLRIKVSTDDITSALHLVASNLALTEPEPLWLRCDHKFIDSSHCLKCGWMAPPEGAISRDDAAGILLRLGVRL